MVPWHDLHDCSSSFLFNSSDWKAPSTARKVHIRRLFDILHLSIQRRDLPRARKAFGLLSRCEEIEWTAVWKQALLLLPDELPTSGDAPRTAKQINFLRVMMLQHPEEVRAQWQPSCLMVVVVCLSGSSWLISHISARRSSKSWCCLW